MNSAHPFEKISAYQRNAKMMPDLEAQFSLMSDHLKKDDLSTASTSSSYKTALQDQFTDLSRHSSFVTLHAPPFQRENQPSVLPKLWIQRIPPSNSPNDIEDTEEDYFRSLENYDSYSDSDADSEMNEAVATVIRQLIDEQPPNPSTESLACTETTTPRRRRKMFPFLSGTIHDTNSSAFKTGTVEKVPFFRRLLRKLTRGCLSSPKESTTSVNAGQSATIDNEAACISTAEHLVSFDLAAYTSNETEAQVANAPENSHKYLESSRTILFDSFREPSEASTQSGAPRRSSWKIWCR